jgi:DNA-binding NarL/FixJ family response regulator
MIRILIADDHPVFRTGLRQILEAEPAVRVVGEATTGDELVAALGRLDVDVLLLDITMPGSPFPVILRHLRTAHPKVRVLVLSMHPESQFAVRALRDGAAGYLTKERSPEELVAAVRKVASGGRYLTTTVADQLAEAVQSNHQSAPHEDLSGREHQILRLLGVGRSLAQIAEELTLSPKTVSTYRARILKKMRLRTTADLIRYTVEHQLTP